MEGLESRNSVSYISPYKLQLFSEIFVGMANAVKLIKAIYYTDNCKRADNAELFSFFFFLYKACILKYTVFLYLNED